MLVCPICGATNQHYEQICNRCGSLLNQQPSVVQPRLRRKKYKKHWIIRVAEDIVKIFFNLLLEIVRFLPRLIQMIIEGISRV